VNEVAEVDEQGETTETPMSPETVLDEEQAEEEAHEAEQAADEPDEAPEQQGATQEVWEKRFQYAEKLFETYRRKIFDKWEEDALTLVPFNIDSGAPPGFIDTRNAGHVDDDTKAAAMEFLGFPREQDYEPDPEASQCPVCKGKGRTKLPTLVPGNDTRTCPQCGGLGYQGVRSTNGHAVVTLDPTHAPAGEREEPLSSGEFDSWQQPRVLPDGRPNPNFGRTPDYWIKVEPWGDTRGLTAQSAVTGG
jgi:hypothetical protein